MMAYVVDDAGSCTGAMVKAEVEVDRAATLVVVVANMLDIAVVESVTAESIVLDIVVWVASDGCTSQLAAQFS